MNEKPVIGVSGPDRGGMVAWLMTALALRRSGARPVRITPSRPCDPDRLQGVVIGGGTDVDPFHYGEESLREPAAPSAPRARIIDWAVSLPLALFRLLFARHSRQDYDRERDTLERGLIEHAVHRGLPVLGICRGAQLMNVVLGGSLHQDIGHFYTEETRNIRSVLPRKSVDVEPATHLQDILETANCQVNALHDQSIKALGEDVRVSAVEPSGVVQAIERAHHRFFIGVQWHPEYMPQSNTQQKLFKALVGSCMTDTTRSVGTANSDRN